MADKKKTIDELIDEALLGVEEQGLICLKRSITLKQLDGSVKHYELRELTGLERDDYLNSLKKMTGKDGVTNFDSLYSNLLKRSMFEVEKEPKEDGSFDPDGKILKETKLTNEHVQQWPAGTQKRLWNAARLLSKLDDGAKEATEGEN